MTIGTLLPERFTCSPEQHLPGCYNPHSDNSYCICGAQRWAGKVGVIISTPRREQPPADDAPHHPHPTITGWDTYQLHRDSCPLRDDEDGHLTLHVCGGAS